ncbi:MAG: hypothetical protein ACOCXO_07125 [Bacteroidota bacterium]
MTKLYFIAGFMLVFAFTAKAQYYQSPDWIKQIPLYGEQTAIGISDPRMENDSLAQLQAKRRAMAMIALLRDVEIAYTSEHYQSETEAHRTYKLEEIIEKLGKFSSRLPYHTSDFEIIHEYTNKNKEVFVLMAYNDSDAAKDHVLKVEADHYSKIFETSITRNFRAAELYSLNISDSTARGSVHYRYRYEADGNDISIYSKDAGHRHSPPGYAYKYRDNDTIGGMSNFDAANSCQDGLWQAYFSGILHAFSEKSKNYISKIKNLEDQYDEAEESNAYFEDSEKQESLSRHITKNKMKFYLHGLSIDQNTLYVNISSPLLSEQTPPLHIEPDTTEHREPEKRKRRFWDWLFGRK